MTRNYILTVLLTFCLHVALLVNKNPISFLEDQVCLNNYIIIII